MRLYQQEKYKVEIGSGKQVGLCTVWGDPEIVMQANPTLMRKVSILGSLYSREGVNVMLRNLALNPRISRLYVWGGTPLSKTQFGMMGWEILQALWKKGVKDSNKVIGTSFYLHKEMHTKAIRQLVEKIELIDISKVPIKSLVDAIKEPKIKVNRMIVNFPEHKRSEDERWPSELVGWVVRGEKIVDAWIEMVDKVMRYGVIKDTEYGNKQRELIMFNWIISSENTKNPYIPNWPDKIRDILRVNKTSLDEYYGEFMTADLPEGVAYTYGSRLWNFGDGGQKKGRINQVEQVINHFKESPVTRRGVMSTWRVGSDGDKLTKNPPCFVTCQFLQTEGKLHALVVFRSHDVYKAAIANAFGLRRLQEYVAEELKFEVGVLAITSQSAHIYEEDWNDAGKLVDCKIRKRLVVGNYNPSKQGFDPRGNVLIRLEDGLIVLELRTREGEGLLTLREKRASKIAFKLARLDLLSKSSHWIDVGMELVKAEICLRLNKKYSQDKIIL